MKNVLHLFLDILIMHINLGSITWFLSGLAVYKARKQRHQNLFAQHAKAHHSFKAIRGNFIAPGVFDTLDQVFPTKLLQIIGSLAGMITGYGRAKNFFDFPCELRGGKSPGMGGKRNHSLHHGPHARPIDIDAADSGLTYFRRKRPGRKSLVVNKRDVHPLEHSQKSFHHDFEGVRDLGKALNPSPITQLSDVVGNYLDSQDAFAFAIHLDRHLPIMDFEDGQMIDRCLDHDLKSGCALGFPPEMGTVFGAEDGLDGLKLKRGTGSINRALKDLIQDATSPKEEIPAILGLVNRIGVPESASPLLDTRKREAQTGVNPTLTGSYQAPYRARSSHGICDPGQACGGRDLGKTIVFLGKWNLSRAGLTRDILMPIEDNLSGKGGMGTEFDRQVAPLRIQDVEGIVLDVRDLSRNVGDALLRALHPENRCRSKSCDDTEDSPESRVLREMGFGRFPLPLLWLTVNQRNTLRGGIGADSPTKVTCEPHQMGIVKILVTSPQPAPPGSKPSGGLRQHEIGIQHNTIDTIIGPGKMRLIGLRKLIGYLHRFFLHASLKHRIGKITDEVNEVHTGGDVLRSYPRRGKGQRDFSPAPPRRGWAARRAKSRSPGSTRWITQQCYHLNLFERIAMTRCHSITF